MDFSFSEDQVAIRETSRRFARARLAPGYLEADKAAAFDPGLVREMGELGLIGVDLPEEFGGLGLDCVTSGIVMEEISRANLNFGYVNLLASLNGSILAHHASRDLAAEHIPKICTGAELVALGLTEPNAGSDATSLRLSAERKGDEYILNGEKTSISMALQAHQIILFARTNPKETGARGISAFLVPLDSPGITRGSFEDLGSSSVGRGWINFEDVRIGAADMIGAEGAGFYQVMNGFDFSRALIGLQCLAAAESSLAETWSYATQRQAFGQAIADFQGVSEPLAVGETHLAAAKLLCYETLWLRDQDKPHTEKAAMCKWWAPQVAFEIIHQCLQIHGHLGYSREFPLQQRLREVLGLHIGDGTKQIQKMVIARHFIRLAREGNL